MKRGRKPITECEITGTKMRADRRHVFKDADGYRWYMTKSAFKTVKIAAIENNTNITDYLYSNYNK